MATAANQQRRGAKAPRGNKAPNSRIVVEFAPGSLEAELSAVGKSVPAREWAKVPPDYFAKLDHDLHGLPKKK